jgi:hypothetical protein
LGGFFVDNTFQMAFWEKKEQIFQKKSIFLSKKFASVKILRTFAPLI